MRIVLALALLLLSVCAWAHDPQLSGIGVAIRGQSATIGVQAHLDKLEVTNVGADIERRLSLQVNGKTFVPSSPEVFVDRGQGVAYWRAACSGPIHSFAITKRLFPEDPGARTIVSVTCDGRAVQETIIDQGHPSMSYGESAETGAWDVIGQFWQLGVMHIFTGPDHILFILGLILLGGGLRPVLKTVTAFTVAHSITLSVAATGLWTPASRYVEPLIALSIIAVAIENLRTCKQGRDWRPLIAFGFGLIHGFGFAGGLTEAGLPHAALGWALASFNVGVETAQAAIVLVVTPCLAILAARKPVVSYRLIWSGSMAIAVAGAFWFVERVFSA